MKFLNNIHISLKLRALIIALAAIASEVNREMHRFVATMRRLWCRSVY